MYLMKEQLEAAKLNPEEEAYLYKLTLYCGDGERVRTWKNDRVHSADEIRRAHLYATNRSSMTYSTPSSLHLRRWL
ncbi:hypothetical protein H6P81_015776 [Aristolochia fimbriata]|uniref:Uncharacterized protein n=1 Tax=Aristolochia fimbriata TaxID=158543 RepID=A0AAV7E9I1_ARIFI|nr:hypothetical protein H6P81_015776 [Aristolochia fimbriata]